MTKLETGWSAEIIPGFNVLQWKRKVQTRIYRETKNMTCDEFLEYLRKGSEKRREERKLHHAERAKSAESNGSDN